MSRTLLHAATSGRSPDPRNPTGNSNPVQALTVEKDFTAKIGDRLFHTF
ncbi:hypothetical protein [Tolypothrix sp. VBCCA 56010]